MVLVAPYGNFLLKLYALWGGAENVIDLTRCFNKEIWRPKDENEAKYISLCVNDRRGK